MSDGPGKDPKAAPAAAKEEAPPEALTRLLQGGRILPCRALDLGCGSGAHALYLAARGFEVTGVDVAPAAIKAAREAAKARQLPCRFVNADVLGPMEAVPGGFEFIYDWELLNQLSPDERDVYLKNVYNHLTPGGAYFSVCFAEEGTPFAASSRFRRTALGTKLYYTSQEDLREAFLRYFAIDDLRTEPVLGKSASLMAVHALMRKRTAPQP